MARETGCPPPPEFAGLCATMTQNRLCIHYSCGSPLIKRWAKLAGVEPQRFVRPFTPLPDDLAERAAEMTAAELARHYGFNDTQMRNMLARAGIEAKRYDQRTPKPKLLKRTSRPAAFRTPKQAHSFDTLRRETTTDGLAADHLRRDCAVYRCTETGRADQTGAWWRYGNVTVTPGELIERAIRKGWSPDAWRRLAA